MAFTARLLDVEGNELNFGPGDSSSTYIGNLSAYSFQCDFGVLFVLMSKLPVTQKRLEPN